MTVFVGDSWREQLNRAQRSIHEGGTTSGRGYFGPRFERFINRRPHPRPSARSCNFATRHQRMSRTIVAAIWLAASIRSAARRHCADFFRHSAPPRRASRRCEVLVLARPILPVGIVPLPEAPARFHVRDKMASRSQPTGRAAHGQNQHRHAPRTRDFRHQPLAYRHGDEWRRRTSRWRTLSAAGTTLPLTEASARHEFSRRST